MINWLHAKLHRPERGWDPISSQHAVEYARDEWRKLDERFLQEIERWLGGFAGKEVLDLGGGPGQYSVAMARRGARVTWHDVSDRYRRIVEQRSLGLQVTCSLGYLEEAIGLGEGRFDLVFNRICWQYSRSDRGFAEILWRLVRPGGIGYVDTTNAAFHFDLLPPSSRLRTRLSTLTGFKVGHPQPPRGRVARLLLKWPIDRMLIDYSQATSDRILFRKAAAHDGAVSHPL
jgi:2-polyprenyl-3-methyl-5-hydroxy-6-metoxy-1,4-benzoquinol methylase